MMRRGGGGGGGGARAKRCTRDGKRGGGGYLYAEVHYLALLSGQAHLEGSLGTGQVSCTAAVYGPEQLHAPGLCIVLVSNMCLQ